MDNTLLSGIISAVATLVSAIIGAVAAIIAALISKTYADKQISKTKTSDEIKPFTRGIIQFFNLFCVTGASVFTVKVKKVFIDSETGITITLDRCFSNRVDFQYHLPGQAKSQQVLDAKTGWRLLVNCENGLYALTLVEIHPLVSIRFDFRKLKNFITEANSDNQVNENR